MAWIEFVVQGAIVVVAAVTVADWLSRGGAQRRDIAFALVPLALLILLPWFPGAGTWQAGVTVAVFLAVPLLYLRLARHVEPLGPGPMALAVVFLAASFAMAYWIGLDNLVALSFLMAAVIAPFLFTGAVTVNAARHREGVARRRLVWTAINATTFAILLLFVLAGMNLESPSGRTIQVALAASYVLAFATPRPIRDAWRAVVFRKFIEASRALGDSTLSMSDRLEAMRRAAAGVVEAEAAFVLEQRGDEVVCVAEDQPFPAEASMRRLLERAHDGVATDGDWTVVGLHAPDQPARALTVRLRSDRLFPGEDEATLEALAQEIDGRFREAAYQEAQQKAREAAEELALFRSDYLQAVGHEVANPLSPIKVEVSNLRRRHGDDRSLQRIARSVDRIEALVRDISAVSRLSAAKLTLETMPVDVGSAIQEAAARYAVLAEEHGCDLEIIIDASLTIPADPMRLQQILDNLLSNAIKYSPDGGQITIGLRKDGAFADIAIQDHGLGLDAAQLERLFLDYGRVHTTVAPHIPGTGMGLYIARQLARLHGGDLEARSDGSGQGATFRLRLPLTGPPAEAPVVDRPPIPGVAPTPPT